MLYRLGWVRFINSHDYVYFMSCIGQKNVTLKHLLKGSSLSGGFESDINTDIKPPNSMNEVLEVPAITCKK